MSTQELIPEHLLRRMTPAELTAYKHHLEVQVHLKSLLTYMQRVTPHAEARPFLQILCNYVDALLEGCLYASGPGPEPVEDENSVLRHPETGETPVYNLAVYAPPRHGKSFAISDHLPAYFETKFPDLKVGVATAGDDFAKYWSDKTLKHLNDPEVADFFGIRVVNGSRAAKETWQIEGRLGEYKCVGVGGQITGRGFHLGIADDLIKNAEDANSEIVRNNVHEWWLTTWWTRREKWPDGTPARMILMNTRWHADDISARVVGGGWCVLRIPALAEAEGPADILNRQPGEALDPTVMTADELRVLDSDDTQNGGMGRQWFAAMYQGRPYIETGNLIKGPFNICKLRDNTYEFQTADGNKEFLQDTDCFRFGMVDLAASVKTYSDYTVIGTFDVTPNAPRRLVLRHLVRVKIGTERHEDEVYQQYMRWRWRFVGVEDKTFGTNLINQLKRRSGIIVRPVKADLDKITRALPLDTMVRNEQLWWPEGADWRQNLEEEVLQFPNAPHDDQVDVLAYAGRLFEMLPRPRRREEEGNDIHARAARQIRNLQKKKKSYVHPQLGRLS